MAMMMDRNKAGFCVCDRCATRSYRESCRGTYRAREERQWRKDAEPPSWASDEGEYVLWLDEVSAREEDPPPPGFDGVWSTESGDVSYG